MLESDGAETSDSGFTGVCLLCSISGIDNLVNEDLTDVTSIELSVGVASAGFVCVDAGRTIPAGRRAGYVGTLNGGLVGLLSNSTLETFLDGEMQESLSGNSALITLAGIGGGNNATAPFSLPFNEICYQGKALANLLAAYDLNYAFVLEASAANSTLTAQPASISANGTAQATITLKANDDLDDPVPGGGDSVRFFTTAGTLAQSVVDHGDGTYSTMLTSSSSVETANISAEVNGQILSDTATVNFVIAPGGGADGATTQISASPSAIVANGTDIAVVEVQARDAWGNDVTSGGDTVSLTASSGVLGAVTDQGDGTYSAQLTSSSVGEAVVTGTVNGDPILDSATVRFKNSVDADASQSSVTADPTSLPADGTSFSIIAVQAVDSDGQPLSIGGDDVELFTTAGTLAASVTDHGNGTYTTTLTAADQAATADISGKINGEPITMTAEVIFSSDVADPATSTVSARPNIITANGTSRATILVEARDSNDTPISNGGDTVQLFTTAGTLLDSVVDRGDGTYSTELTSSTSLETATISGMINGQPMTDTATVAFVANSGGGADADSTRISASPTAIVADGVDSAGIEVQARDVWGNDLTTGGDTVVLSATAGSLGTVTDEGDGTYTAQVTSGTIGEALITGTINGDPIADSAWVRFENAVEADASQSSASADPDTLPADGSSTSLITIQVLDSSGTPMSVGGDDVQIFTTLGTLGGTVTDNGDGTYTAILTAPLVAGTAQISATINGEPIGFETQVEFFDPTEVVADNSTINAQPASITANGDARATITVEARNEAGELTGVGGDMVTLSTDAGTISTSVLDHGDGIYTATLTSSTVVETATVTGTINEALIGDAASVQFVANSGGPADPTTTTVQVNPNIIAADGIATATVTVEARDAWGNAITTGGDEVAIATTSGSLGNATDVGDGTYTATLTAPGSPGQALITATLNGDAVDNTATVEFFNPAPEVDATQSFIEAHPDTLPPDGVSTATITVRAVDGSGNPMSTGGDDVTLVASAGTLGSTVTDNGDGTYTATFTAPTQSGVVTIGGMINGVPIGGDATVIIGDGDSIFSDRFEAAL